MPKKTVPPPIASTWSEPSNGLCGRLRVEFEDLNPGLRHAVYLELMNQSFEPIAVSNKPEIRAELYDAFSQPVPRSAAVRSGPLIAAEWAVVPRDAYIGFRIDMQSVGVPTREQGKALVAVGGKSWEVSDGKYVLMTALVLKKGKHGPENQWIGELELPAIEVVVTPEALAVN